MNGLIAVLISANKLIRIPLSVCFGLRFQPVIATHWLNRSAGVSKSSVCLGCLFSSRGTT
jgi:hypothetical protein